MKLKIRKGAKVEVTTGADKGRQGVVLEVNTTTMRLRVEGVRIQTRHSKQNGVTKSEGMIAYSNVKLIEAASATAGKKKTAKKASSKTA